MIRYILFLALSYYVLAGCCRRKIIEPLNSDDIILFGQPLVEARIPIEVKTLETTTLSTATSVEVSAWSYEGETLSHSPFFDQQILSYKENEWTLSHTYFWPSMGNTDLRMVAFAPSQSSSENYTAYEGSTSPNPQISTNGIKLGLYVPQESINQTDVRYTVPHDFIKGNKVNLLFKSALTKVSFNISMTNDSALIKEIVLNHIPNNGFLQTSDVAVWTLPDDVATSEYIIYQDSTGEKQFYADQASKPIGDQHLLIPQLLTDEMTFDIDLKIGSQHFSLQDLKLNALQFNQQPFKSWEPGTLVNYHLTINNERIDFEDPSVENFTIVIVTL